MRIILTLLFLAWVIYAIKIAIDTNKKYFDIENGLSPQDCKKMRKKLMRNHFSKIFIGLFVVLVIILVLIFVESKFD